MSTLDLSYAGKHSLRLVSSILLITLVIGLAQTQVAQAAAYVVSKTADTNDGTCDGDCSLREAIVAANASASSDTITFSVNGTITLGSNLPPIINNGALTITGNGMGNTIISGNNTFRGFNSISADGVQLTLENLQITNGFVAGTGFGGAIDIDSTGGVLTLNNVLLTNGRAGYGGGINGDDGTIIINNSIIRDNFGNTVSAGIWTSSRVTLRLVNTLVTGNQGPGGGVFSNGGIAEIYNSTIWGNTATSVYAAGVDSNGGTLTIRNSIVANNTGGAGDCYAGFVNEISSSLIGDGSCGVVSGTNGNLTGDPALNGDMTLSSTSPAIDAGDDSLIPVGVTTDLAGNNRIQGFFVDMGAYESAFSAPPIVTISPTTMNVNEGSSADFTITRTGRTSSDLAVSLNITQGAGTLAADYSLSGGSISGQQGSVTIIIPAGQASVNVNLTATDDAQEESDETLTLDLIDGTAYDLGTPNSATATIIDTDTAGIAVNPTSGLVTTEAGGTAQFTVVLNTQPSVDVTINLSSSDTSEGTVPASITFTNADWNVAQTVTVTGVDDAAADGNIAYTILTSVTSADAIYAAIDPDDVSVTNSDDDAAGVTITPTTLTATEGSNLTYQIRFASVPGSPVTLQISFDPAQVNVNGSTTSPVTLTISDSAPHIITVLVVQNPDENADRAAIINHAITASIAPEYPVGMALPDVTVNIDDVPPPPPTPLCEDHNFAEGGIVRASTVDGIDYAVNCRILYQNGQPTQWLGGDLYNAGAIGIQGIFDLGVQQAVDIFSPVGMNYFEGGAVFCLRGQGTLIWLAARNAPRIAEIIGSYTVDDFPGFTCATLFEPGTLVLVRDNPIE